MPEQLSRVEDVTIPSDPADLPESTDVREETVLSTWKTILKAHPNRLGEKMPEVWQRALLEATNLEHFLSHLECIDNERALDGGPEIEVHPYILGPSSSELHFSIEMFFKKILKHVSDTSGGAETYNRPELMVGRFVAGLNLESIPGVNERLSELLIARYGELLDTEKRAPFSEDAMMHINVATELLQVKSVISKSLSSERATLLNQALDHAAQHNLPEAYAYIHHELFGQDSPVGVERFLQYGISPKEAGEYLLGTRPDQLPLTVLESMGGQRLRARMVRNILFTGGYFPAGIDQDRLVGLVLHASTPIEA
jgi:hypothetical protein